MKTLRYAAVVVAVLAAARAGGSPKPPVDAARIFARLRAAATYQATVSMVTTVQPAGGGQGATIQGVETIRYRKPNYVVITVAGIAGGIRVVSDGKTMYRFSGLTNEYTVQPAPASFMDTLIGGKHLPDLRAVGADRVNGVPVTIYRGSGATPRGTMDFTVKIGTKDNLPYQLTESGSSMGPRGRMTVRSDQKIDMQVVNKPIPVSQFTFIPPKGARKVLNLGGAENEDPEFGSVGGMFQ